MENEEFISRDLALTLCPHIAEETLRMIPAADVAPRKHGRNVGEYPECDQFVCSECGIELRGWFRIEYDEDDGSENCYEYEFNFCPNCGADLIGKTEQEVNHEPID